MRVYSQLMMSTAPADQCLLYNSGVALTRAHSCRTAWERGAADVMRQRIVFLITCPAASATSDTRLPFSARVLTAADVMRQRHLTLDFLSHHVSCGVSDTRLPHHVSCGESGWPAFFTSAELPPTLPPSHPPSLSPYLATYQWHHVKSTAKWKGKGTKASGDVGGRSVYKMKCSTLEKLLLLSSYESYWAVSYWAVSYWGYSKNVIFCCYNEEERRWWFFFFQEYQAVSFNLI